MNAGSVLFFGAFLKLTFGLLNPTLAYQQNIVQYDLPQNNEKTESQARDSCDLFIESQLCISQLYNLGSHTFTDHEVSCQELCRNTLGCEYFTLVQAEHQAPAQCYLWKVCRATVDCATSGAECVSSVLGPASPSLTTSCCHLFQRDRKCSSSPLLSLTAREEVECQQACRDHASTGCRYLLSLLLQTCLQVLLVDPLWLPPARHL